MKRNNAAKPYFQAFYRGNRLNWCLAMVFTILTAPQMLMISWMLGELMDVAAAGDLAALKRLFWLTLLMVVYWCVTDLGNYWFRSRFAERAVRQYKDLAFRRLTEKSISAFTRESSARYLSMFTNDIPSVEMNYLLRSFGLLFHGLSFLLALGMMLWYSPVLTATVVVLCLLPMLVSLLMGGGMAERERTVSDCGESFVARLKDLLSGFAVIKSFKSEGEAVGLFAQANCDLERHKFRRRWWELLMTTLGQTGGILLQTGVLLMGALLVIRGRMTVGTVLMFTNLCNSLIQPIQVIPEQWANRRAARALVEKLAQVTEENAGRSGLPIPAELREGIRLEGVTFGYEADKPVLRDVSLHFEPGKKYAVVGASGSGKTTLLNLLMGGWEDYSGSITVDGCQLREVDPDSLYDLISLIGQSVFLFDDTIRQNLTMFRDFPREAVEKAVKESGLTELVAERGADFRCGENGGNLSGGERQRVSIARALLRGTPVLMLDEATAALDNRTAFEVTQAILDLVGLTSIVVTHRLEGQLLRQYDEIIVLRSGEVCERGSFETLMGERGYFYSLYTVTNS